jgi:hypothetical protein
MVDRTTMRAEKMIRYGICGMTLCLLAVSASLLAAEFSTFRLLSISETEKLILVSQIPEKTKYLLDAASAKITMNGKPAEYKALKTFSIIHVKMTVAKTQKQGIYIDGTAIEIRIDSSNSAQ